MRTFLSLLLFFFFCRILFIPDWCLSFVSATFASALATLHRTIQDAVMMDERLYINAYNFQSLERAPLALVLWGRVESWFISFSCKHFSNLSVVLVQTENLFVNTIQGIYLSSVLDSVQRINNPNSLRFTNRTLKKRKLQRSPKISPLQKKKQPKGAASRGRMI